MSDNKSRSKKKDRRQRWAAIIAAILAVAMALSAIAAYAGHLLNRGQGSAAPPEQQFDMEEYRSYCSGEVERLEQYLAEYGAAAGVLSELCKNYRLLIQIEKAGDEVDDEKVKGYEAALKEYSRDLVELEPDHPEHRLQLLYLYSDLGEDDRFIDEEIGALQELLREKTDPYAALGLIEFMKVSEQPPESIAGETAWLKEYFEELSDSANLTNSDRYAYAFLLGEYLEEVPAALDQLALVLESEAPEKELYQTAEKYQKALQQREKEKKE